MIDEKKNIILESIKFGFRALYEHIFLFTLTILICVGIVIFGGIVSLLFFLKFGWIFSVLHIGLIIPLFLVLALMVMIFFTGLWLGINKIALDLYDYDKSSVKKLFSCMRLAPKASFAAIMYLIAVGIGSICFVIPGIFLAIRFSLFSYFIVDQTVGPIQSLKMSYKTTKKYGWQLFIVRVIVYLMTTIPTWCGAFLIFMGMPIPSLLLSFVYGLSIIVAMPVSFFVYTYFYRTLVPKISYNE